MMAPQLRSLVWLGAGAVLTVIAARSLWPGTASVTPPPSPAVSRQSEQQLKDYIEFLRADAAAQGISPSTFAVGLDGVTLDPDVIELAATQPELTKSAGEYVTRIVSENRVAAGRQKLDEHAPLLAQVERDYGVDRHVVLAIWGVESSYGSGMGMRSVIRSLLSLAAFDRRRPEFWRNELLAALHLLQQGIAAPDLIGSWAGAMGHTQFMPSTFAQHAVDFDRDGKRDVRGSIADALASTANYLRFAGWKSGVPWGFEVRLAPGFDYGLSMPAVLNTWAEWQELGAAPARPDLVPGSVAALQLLLPAGAGGPAFLVGDNYRALLRYNNSTAYALAVGILADAIRGAPPLVAGWPASDRSLARTEREEIQRRLGALGFDAGEIDGVIGNATKAAIRLFQKTRALVPDGHADLALLERLRQEDGR